MRTDVPFDVLDIHHHVGSLAAIAGKASSQLKQGLTLEQDAASRIEYMDGHGIDQCLLMPGEFPMASGQSIQDINASVSTYRAFHPDRFPAHLATTDPRDVIASVDEIDRCVEAFAVAGLVWHHHFFGAFVNDPAMFEIVAHAERHRLPIFIHIIDGSFLESPWRLEQLADAFPGTTFVALDGFSSPDRAQWMVYLAEKHPNILFDTGVATSVSHMLPRFIASVGADRLLFGSDFYLEPRFFEVPFVLYELLNSGVDEAALAEVFGGNARRLLQLQL